MQHGNFRWHLKSGDILFFLHIPKTAGTTIYSMLQKRYKKSQILILPDENLRKYFDFTSPDDFEQYRFCRQHYSYEYYRYFPRKLIYLTMLRKPIDRLVSYYRHINRTKSHHLHEEITEKKVDLYQFIKNYSKFGNSNLQTKMLVGNRFLKCKDEDLLEIAKMRLNEFAFFGIQELFEDSIQLLGHTFFWGNLKFSTLNVAPSQPDESILTPEAVEIITRVNQLDLEIYAYALDLFNARIKLMLSEID